MIALDRRYLADRDEAPAYCHACGQPLARAAAYLLNDAIADYRLEVGDARTSGDSIAARLKHVSDYLAATDRQATSCAEACSPVFVDGLRKWSQAQPVTWRNKAGQVTVSKPRAPATTEESVIQLAAVLNHAAEQRRSDARPAFKNLSRARVSSPRRVRCDVPTLARMFGYAAGASARVYSLHAFLVGSICTMARPEAICDISTAPERRQWWPGAASIDLNPAGRAQTKKTRPVLPVLPLLDRWLRDTHAGADRDEAQKAGIRFSGGWLVNFYGRSVIDIDQSWSTMLAELGLPTDREWRPYVLRHSLATLMRGRGVPKWELQGFMGHRTSGVTETYAVEEQFPNVLKALTDIQNEIEALAPGSLHRTGTGASISVLPLRRSKMT